MRALRFILALAIIIPAGVVQGLWAGRWSASEEFEARLARLARIPNRVGGWVGRDVCPEPRALERAGIEGGLMRK